MIKHVCMALAVMALAASAARADDDVAAMGGPAAALFGLQCSPCHGIALEGGEFGPALKGDPFVQHWSGKETALFNYVTTTMPPGSAGVISDGEYEQIVSLILKINGDALKEAAAAKAEAAKADAAKGAPAKGQARAPGQPAAVPPASAPSTNIPTAFWDETYTRELAAQKALLDRLSPVTPAMLKSPPPQDWLSWRRTQDDSGFSPLDQINKTNVAGLKLKWAFSAKHGRNEIAPIVHDGVMFINSAYDVEALDARTGMRLWRYRRDIAPQFRGPLNMLQKSIAISGRMLIVPTADRHLVALDVTSGAVVWDTEVVPKDSPAAVMSAGPLVAGDVLVQGISLGPMCKGGCSAAGVDAKTGKLLWRFNTVARDNSWNGTPVEERSGASIWNTASYDPDLDLVFFGTGNVYDISRLLRPETPPPGQTADALYSNSTIALRPKTGKLVWYHQHFPHEVWDLDEVFERSLINMPIDGKPQKLVVSIGKVGVLDALDRATGRYEFSIDLGLQNLITSIDPKTGKRTTDPAKRPVPNKSIDLCPTVQGVRNWMATAFNPSSHVLYIPMMDACMDFTWNDPQGTDSKMDMGWRFKPRDGSDGRYGLVAAYDLTTRKPLWTIRTRAVPLSSLLATGGGLIFSGISDRSFRALDDQTGKVLWETRLSGPPNATPVTFSIDGHQYVAISSGGGGSHESDAIGMTPEVTPGAAATTIWVFGL